MRAGFGTSDFSRSRTIAPIRWWFLILLACSITACGFGTNDDTGAPVPKPWWPWVCADGTEPVGDGGCSGDASSESMPEPIDGGIDEL